MNWTIGYSNRQSILHTTARAVARLATTITCLAAVTTWSGCGSAGEPTLAPDSGPTSAQRSVEETPAAQDSAALPSQEDLPPLADPLPPLDKGRVAVAGPQGWHVPPRDPRWLARFQLVAGNPYPAIFVQLPEEHDGAEEVTADNAAAFATNLEAQLRRELEAKGLTAPAVEPLVIGDFAGAQYVRQATTKEKKLRLERLYLVTVHEGRRYTIELDALFGTLSQFRGHALAVAAGMEFLAPSEASEASEPTSP